SAAAPAGSATAGGGTMRSMRSTRPLVSARAARLLNKSLGSPRPAPGTGSQSPGGPPPGARIESCPRVAMLGATSAKNRPSPVPNPHEKELNGCRRRTRQETPLWPDLAQGRVVGPAARHVHRLLVVRGLRDVGPVAGQGLLLRQLPVASLLT